LIAVDAASQIEHSQLLKRLTDTVYIQYLPTITLLCSARFVL
jgi:hypothetical protein